MYTVFNSLVANIFPPPISWCYGSEVEVSAGGQVAIGGSFHRGMEIAAFALLSSCSLG